MINDQAWNADTFLPTVGKRGAAIIAARGVSSAASAANAAIDHMHDWALGTNGGWVTMGVPSNGEYGIPEGRDVRLPGHLRRRASTRSSRACPSTRSRRKRIDLTLAELLGSATGSSTCSDRTAAERRPCRPRPPAAGVVRRGRPRAGAAGVRSLRGVESRMRKSLARQAEPGRCSTSRSTARTARRSAARPSTPTWSPNSSPRR